MIRHQRQNTREGGLLDHARSSMVCSPIRRDVEKEREEKEQRRTHFVCDSICERDRKEI